MNIFEYAGEARITGVGQGSKAKAIVGVRAYMWLSSNRFCADSSLRYLQDALATSASWKANIWHCQCNSVARRTIAETVAGG